MTDQELRQWVESVQPWVEKTFKNQGCIPKMFHAVTREGKDVAFRSPSDDKDICMLMVRAAFQKLDAVRYLHIDEAWTLEVPDGSALAARMKSGALLPSQHPDRREIVMISAEAEGCAMLMASRAIIRPARGKATLGPLNCWSPSGELEGRMVGLLPVRMVPQ